MDLLDDHQCVYVLVGGLLPSERLDWPKNVRERVDWSNNNPKTFGSFPKRSGQNKSDDFVFGHHQIGPSQKVTKVRFGTEFTASNQ